MPRKQTKVQSIARMGPGVPLPDVLLAIGERLEARLLEGAKRGEVVRNNLEDGLGAETVLRDLLEEMLPARLGVGKGKIVNSEGEMSRHLDLMLYDRLNFPRLFVDEQDNLILPIESIFAAVEVKTHTTASSLRDASETLASVAVVAAEVRDILSESVASVEFSPPSERLGMVIGGLKGSAAYARFD